jgi:vesicular inhibitory amino acid transporter
MLRHEATRPSQPPPHTPSPFCCPLHLQVEELLPQGPKTWAFTAASLAVRTGILAATVAVALTVPFFAAVMSFIGAFLSMSIAIVLPCVFYVAIFWRRLGAGQLLLPVAVGLLGVVAGTAATYESVMQVVGKY